MFKKTAIAAALGALSALPAWAQVDENPPRLIETMGRPIYLAPMISFTIDDSARDTKVGYGGTLALGTRVTSFLAVEAQAYYTRFNDEGDVFRNANTHVNGYGANLLLFPLSGGWRNSFLLLGSSYNEARNHPATVGANRTLRDYESVVYDVGLGQLSQFTLFGNPAAGRVEARYRLDQHDEAGLGDGSDDQFGDVVLSVGLMMPLFYQPPPPPPPPPPAVVPVVLDSDGDGVNDDVDQCPNTPPGTEVDSVGCPLPPPPACTPTGEGGIDLRGCEAGDVVVLRGVNFEFDQDRLTVNARTLLDDVVAALAAAPEIAVEIAGHTDSLGSDAYNQRLSERRAKAVRDYLISQGVEAGRLSEKGYGEAEPVADNATEEGRELNRRVELRVQ
jgi:OmpA-OmpF porin, OOP family